MHTTSFTAPVGEIIKSQDVIFNEGGDIKHYGMRTHTVPMSLYA